MELNQIDQAQISYEYAHTMGRNTMEIWFKIIGGFSKQDIPIKLEVRCEKSIIQFVMVLLVQSTCFEIYNQYYKAIETISLADWFASKLLLYDSSAPIKQKIREQSEYMKEKYGDLLQEEAEIYKILRKLDEKQIDPYQIKQKEDTNRKQKIQDDLNTFLYNKAECEQLNQNMKIFIKKPAPEVKDNKDVNNRSQLYISSSENINLLNDPLGKSQNVQIEFQQPQSLSQLFIPNSKGLSSPQNQIQGQENVKNYLSSNQGVKNIHNKSLSEVPSFFNEQTTQLTGGIGTSKFYSFYGNQLQGGHNSTKNKSFRGGYTGGNVIDQTLLGSGQNSQLNTNRQSFSIHGLDLQSIINFPQNSVNNPNMSSNTVLPQVNQKNSSNDINLNGSFHTQGNPGSPMVFSSIAYYGGQNNQQYPILNNNNIGGGNSNNSSFNGQNLQFNSNNVGSMPMMSDCFIQGNPNIHGLSSLTTPRNQDLSQVIQDPLNQSNQGTINNFNQQLQANKGTIQQPSRNSFQIHQNKVNADRRGTLEQTYQIFDRPASAKASTSSHQFSKSKKNKNQKEKQNYHKKKNLSMNQHELNKLNQNDSKQQYRNSISHFHPQYIGSKNYLNPDYGNEQGVGVNPNLLYPTVNTMGQNPSSNKLTIHSTTRLDSQKQQGDGKKSLSQSKMATINNINQQSYLSGKNQSKKDEEVQKLKVITSELYINSEPPKFKEEPEKINDLKQKYRFMRDDENDVREAQLRAEVKYRFMKIPLDQRRDLIDLDICMKKIIQEQLVAKTDHQNYPHIHWVCGKTLQQVNMDKKEFSFANLMVQFKQKNGNGKSIPPVLEKEDTTFSFQREIKLFNEQTAIVQAKEKVKQQQVQEQMLDNQAFQKILDSNRIKPQKQNLDLPPQEIPEDVVVRTGVSESIRGKLFKAAVVQKQLDEGYDGQTTTNGKRSTSLFAHLNQQLEDEKYKKRSHHTQHQSNLNTLGKQGQQDNQSAQASVQNENSTIQQQVDKADSLLKQVVLFNEQEREKINKEIEFVQNKHTKIGMKDLIKTLVQKEEDTFLQKSYAPQKQKSNLGMSHLNQSSAVNDNNETGITHTEESDDRSVIVGNSRTQKFKNSHGSPIGGDSFNKSKTPKSKSTTNINPTYFNLDYLKKEFGNQLQSNDSKKSNIAFEVDKFLGLASSTKNISQLKLLKQNPFNITDVALLNKIKNQDNNGGGTSKNQPRGKGMPRRFTLLASQKKLE